MGGSGSDRFLLNSAIEQVETILDFSSLEGDKIEISQSAFGGITDTSNFYLNTADGSLLFGNQRIATLQGVSSFNVSTDITIRFDL